MDHNSGVHRCLEPGMSIVVGTVDTHGQPASCRGVAIRSEDNLDTLTVFLPVSTSHETIKNVALTKWLAVTSTYPLDNSATQIKGTATETRLAREEEGTFVEERFEAFTGVLRAFGVPGRLAQSLSHWPVFAVTIRVDQIFEFDERLSR
jgi:hypothetical protein